MNRRATALLAALALTGGVIAGCGGDEDAGASADGASQDMASGAPQGVPAGIEKFEACLAEHGVEVPDRTSGGPPPDGGMSGEGPSDEVKKAFEACQDELPEGAGPPTGGSGGPPNLDQNGSAPDTQRQ
jgi:hypothetical protein